MRTVLETTGQVCPFPVIEAEEAMEELSTGDELVIGFDCTQGTQTLPAWAPTTWTSCWSRYRIPAPPWRRRPTL